MSYPIYESFKGLVGPRGFTPDNTEIRARFSRYGEMVVAQGRGVYGEACSRGMLSRFGVSGVTIPVVASNLVSVFGIYNPPDSGVDVEIIDTDISQVLATTVVDAFGWYFDATAALSAAATFTTRGTERSARLGGGVLTKARVYSAVTHSGTPVKGANIGQDGAVTNAGSASRRKQFEGSLLLAPGFLASVAASTAAGTASGLAIDIAWLEVPIL